MNKPADAMQLLEKHFDTAFAAPDGIKKLRELILTLAMQGKLVPQDPKDQTACELLKEIEAEKKRLVKEGKIKEPKLSLEIKPEEETEELPEGWEWARLGDTVDILDSKRKPITKHDREPGPYPYYGASDVVDYVANFIFDEPLVLVGEDGAKWGCGDKTAFAITGKTWVNNHAHVLRPIRALLSDHFLIYAINKMDLNPFITGMTVPKLNQARLVSIMLPLPPLAEQRRIVAKIDQLMARCDELEKLRAEYGQKRISAHTAALNRLLTATEGETFSATWAFIMQNFGELYSVKENVTELRKAILQLAVMGKLVPQDANDQPARELLKEIEEEKKRLVKAGKIKAPKPLPAIKPEEVPYELPTGWECVRFGELATEITTGPFGSMIHKSDYIENGVPLINPSHMVNGKIIHDQNVTVSAEKAKELDSHKLFEDDIVMARRGEMGRCAIVDSHSHQWLCGTGSFVLRFIRKIDRYYILTLFKTESVRAYLGGNSVGATMTNLNHGILNKMPVVVPPPAEQHRIVAKIDQLMALCDDLEKQIDSATGKQTALLNAVMAQV